MSNQVELTPLSAKDYHGIMIDSNTAEKPKGQAPVRVDEKMPEERVAIPDKSTKNPPLQEVKAQMGSVEDKRNVEQGKTDTVKDKRKEEVVVRRRLMGRRENNEEQKIPKEEGKGGILAAFLEFLMSLIGTESKDDIKMSIEKSEAMKGLLAYWSIRPQNKWNATDYARVIEMLTPDTSNAAVIIKDNITQEAKSKGIESSVFSARAQIETELHEANGKAGISKRSPDREAKHRAIQMNYELWKELAGKDELSKLSAEELLEFNEQLRQLISGEATEDLEKATYLFNGLSQELGKDRPLTRATGSERLAASNGVIVGNGSGEKGGSEGNGGGKEKPPGSGSGDGRDGGDGDDPQREQVRLLKDQIVLQKQSVDIMTKQLNLLREISDKITVITTQISGDPYDKTLREELIMHSKRQAEAAERLVQLNSRERDKTIDSVLGEKMDGINYLIEVRKNPSDSKFDPDQAKTMQERHFLIGMKLLYQKLVRESRNSGIDINILVAQEESKRFEELQRWIKVIIKNSQHNTANVHPELFLPDETYKDFKDLGEMSANIYDYGDLTDSKTIKNTIDKYEAELENAVNILEGKGAKEGKQIKGKKEAMRIRDYFEGVEYSQGLGKEVSGIPSNLEETAQLIIRTWPIEKYAPGEEFEIFNKKGEFQMKNFKYWMELRMREKSLEYPQSQIDPLNMIQIEAGWTRLNLAQILSVPQYTQQREVKISGDARDLNTVKAELGVGNEHPQLNFDRRIDLIVESWLHGVVHNAWVGLHGFEAKNTAGGWITALGGVLNENNLFRGDHWWRLLKTASLKGNEVEDYYNKGEQGSLGLGRSSMMLAFRHLTEFSEYYTKKDDHGKVTGVRPVEGNGENGNMFYSVLEYNGSSVFLQGVAEGALNYGNAAEQGKSMEEAFTGATIKERYRKFILKQIDHIEARYSDSKFDKNRERLNQLLKISRKKVDDMSIKDIKIRFDSADKLEDLLLNIENVALGKRIVSEKEKDDYKLKNDKAVTKDEVKRDVKKLMRENVKGDFFDQIKTLRIPLPEGTAGRGADGRLAIGEIEVHVAGNEKRIVTKEEWDEIDRNRRSSTTIGAIMDEFVDFGSDVDLEKSYEDACKQGDNVTIDRYKKMFERNERLAFALLTKVANVSRKSLNFFNAATPPKAAIDIMRESLTKSIGETHGLNMVEADLAYMFGWYGSSPLRVKAFNNTSGVSNVDQGTRHVRTLESLNSAQGLGPIGGIFKGEINATASGTALETIDVKLPGEADANLNLIGIMQGNKPGESGRKVAHLWERKLSNDNNVYLVDWDDERIGLLNNLQNGNNLFDKLLKNQDDHLQAVAKYDANGMLRIDHAKAVEIFDKWWNTLRNIYDLNGIDFDKTIRVDGREVKVFDHMFGKHIKGSRDVLQKYYEKKAVELEKDSKGFFVSKKKAERLKKDSDAYKLYAERIEKEPAIAVMAYMAATEIHDHKKRFKGTHQEWPMEEIDKIWGTLDHFLRRSGRISREGNEVKIEEMPSMLPFGALNKVLGVHKGRFLKDSMEKYEFLDLFFVFCEAMVNGVKGSLEEFSDEVTQLEKVVIGH